jgi:hypothetical protein
MPSSLSAPIRSSLYQMETPRALTSLVHPLDQDLIHTGLLSQWPKQKVVFCEKSVQAQLVGYSRRLHVLPPTAPFSKHFTS